MMGKYIHTCSHPYIHTYLYVIIKKRSNLRGSEVGTWEELEKGEREIEFDVKRYLCMKFSKKYNLNKKAITGNYIKLRNTRDPVLKFWLSRVPGKINFF